MALFGSKKNSKLEDKKEKKEKKLSTTAKSDAPSMKDLYSAEAPVKKVKTKVVGKSKTSETKVTVKGGDLALASQILIKPLITEKATHLAADNKYVFLVAKQANKISVAKAVAAVYGVKALRVNILNVKGKTVQRNRIKGKRKDWRKAIVTLAKGQSIKIYEGV